ncbi:MAG: hypothetical protein AAB116_23320 [Candidatus Poribacteria bacterium]
MNNLSGRKWWLANQGRYPNSRNIDDLEPDFKKNVVEFIAVLKNGGAKISVASTRRNAIRAYLMHYSWRIANENFDPENVPSMKGVNIVWDHGDEKSSRIAAREMVDLFGIAFRPSLTSNHIKGSAIDMDIKWTGTLFLGPLRCGISEIDEPRNGATNRELHKVGEQFGVGKLLKDPPHWSFNGR